MNKKVENLLKNQLYELIPSNLAVIDKDYNIIVANKNFEDYFGDFKKKKCYQAYKKKDKPCSHCQVHLVFEDGIARASNEQGIDKNNKTCFYAVHWAPLKEEDGSIDYVVETSTDVTETTRYQKEYNILFERVPAFITVIDRDFKIVRANKKFRDTFGEVKGRFCYEVYKKKKKKCKNCPTLLTFQDGKNHTSTEVGHSATGVETHYIVRATPLSVDEGDVTLVIEIATDITEIVELQKEVSYISNFLSTLIHNSQDAILAVNSFGQTEIFNPAARRLFNWASFKKPVLNQMKEMMPEEFFTGKSKNGEIIPCSEITVTSSKGEKIPVRIKAVELNAKKKILGRVAFMQDLRDVRDLEKQKIDAERLAAVGQTVAGLAHTIKNLLMGLEGGMYMVDTGLKNSDASRIIEGWEVLQSNFNKTTTLVKDFLSFSKGRIPDLMLINPNDLVKNIYELYKDAAAKQGIKMCTELSDEISELPLDPDGMEACLTNFVSNAIDAAIPKNGKEGKVLCKTYINGENLIFEVSDNGIGMDTEVRSKLFTTFFTTKGGKGTGLGLLTTRKIVAEHGGKIEFNTEINKGSTFRIVLPIQRLNTIYEELNKLKNKSGD